MMIWEHLRQNRTENQMKERERRAVRTPAIFVLFLRETMVIWELSWQNRTLNRMITISFCAHQNRLTLKPWFLSESSVANLLCKLRTPSWFHIWNLCCPISCGNLEILLGSVSGSLCPISSGNLETSLLVLDLRALFPIPFRNFMIDDECSCKKGKSSRKILAGCDWRRKMDGDVQLMKEEERRPVFLVLYSD